MTKRNGYLQNGQSLAHVAILMIVLLAFAGLAIDGGRIYLERRRMQNAADAGALAGAREICFGDGSQSPLAVAEQYAIDQNGADQAEATWAGGQDDPIRVVASRQVLMSLANIVGFSQMTVGASATAKCGKAVTSGGLWPLSLKIEDYEDIACGEKFYVFTDDNLGKGVDCNKCVCDLPIPGGGTMERLAPGARGYLRLFPPPAPLPGPDHPDCGANDLKYYFANSHPGPVSVCDIVPGEPGVDSAVENSVDSRYGDRVNIVLWDDDLACTGGEVLGTCPGSPYRVAGFGCLVAGIDDGTGEVWKTVTFQPKPGYKAKDCPNNVKVIVAAKQCPCDSMSGGTGGELCNPPDVCAVNLIE